MYRDLNSVFSGARICAASPGHLLPIKGAHTSFLQQTGRVQSRDARASICLLTDVRFV